MYQTGTLNITGNSTADKTASPTPSPKEPTQQDNSTAAMDSISTNNDIRDDTDTSVAYDSSSHTTEHRETSNPSPETDHELYSHGGSPTTEGGNNHNPSTTFVIDEDHLYDFLQDDMSDTESNSPGTTPQPTVSPPHQRIFQSILSDQVRPIPRIPPQDRVSSTEPDQKVVTTEYFQKCLGFRNIEPILKHLESQSTNTVTVQDTGKHPILSRGETATLAKHKKNSNPITKPPEYGWIWHYDIVYSNGRAIRGIHYALFFVDRKSRQKKIIGLKNLQKESLQRAMKTFV